VVRHCLRCARRPQRRGAAAAARSVDLSRRRRAAALRDCGTLGFLSAQRRQRASQVRALRRCTRAPRVRRSPHDYWHTCWLALAGAPDGARAASCGAPSAGEVRPRCRTLWHALAVRRSTRPVSASVRAGGLCSWTRALVREAGISPRAQDAASTCQTSWHSRRWGTRDTRLAVCGLS
jgi:hypothetical protein